MVIGLEKYSKDTSLRGGLPMMYKRGHQDELQPDQTKNLKINRRTSYYITNRCNVEDLGSLILKNTQIVLQDEIITKSTVEGTWKPFTDKGRV